MRISHGFRMPAIFGGLPCLDGPVTILPWASGQRASAGTVRVVDSLVGDGATRPSGKLGIPKANTSRGTVADTAAAFTVPTSVTMDSVGGPDNTRPVID